ncbi:MAG: hypothetical protein JJ872_10355 [Marivivens sp.]|nr:hypothetical protein [Marivivens sp.]
MISHTTVTALALAILVPYLARIPGMAVHGPEWLWSYFPSLFGIGFFAAFAAIPGAALAFLAYLMPKQDIAFSLGAGLMTIALFFLHATLDLASDSTAAIALVIIPFMAMIAMAGGFAMGAAITWLARRKT